MYEISITDAFAVWLESLDKVSQALVAARLDKARRGLLGDCKSLGGGISEMRVHNGPGYRLYFTIRGRQLILMLAGGDKSTQTRDIVKAKAMVRKLE